VSEHTSLIIWKLVSRIDRRSETTLFSDRQAAERERTLVQNAYGTSATTRLTPIRVACRVQVVR
jgi:hypothetical protein